MKNVLYHQGMMVLNLQWKAGWQELPSCTHCESMVGSGGMPFLLRGALKTLNPIPHITES